MTAVTITVRRTTGERVPVKVPEGVYWFCTLHGGDGDDFYARNVLIRTDDRKDAHKVARREAAAGELLSARETIRMPYPEVAVLILNGWDVLNA